MTDSQFELFVMHSGMVQEGLKSEEALAYIIRAGLASSEDIEWLAHSHPTFTQQWLSSVLRVANV